MTGFRLRRLRIRFRCIRIRTRIRIRRIRFRRKGRPHPLREVAACVQWLRVIQVQLLPPHRSLVVAVVGNVVVRDIDYRSTVRLRQAACPPEGVRYVEVVGYVSHDDILSQCYGLGYYRTCT